MPKDLYLNGSICSIWHITLQKQGYGIHGFLAKSDTGTVIRSPIEIDAPENIYTGKRVRIAPYAWLSAKPLVEGIVPRLEIGDGTAIGRFFHCTASNSVILEENVLIAERVYISDHTHNHYDTDVPIIDAPIKNLGTVKIGAGSWIGDGAMIFGNITIGKHAVIGAGSIVRDDVPDYGVAVGTPARVVKIIKH